MKKTVILLVMIMLVMVLAGCINISRTVIYTPLTNTTSTPQTSTTEAPTTTPAIPAPTLPLPTLPLPTIPQTTTLVQGINPVTGTYKNYYLGLVTLTDGNKLAGDGCNDDKGDFIVLINNKNATNPTYDQLLSFLQSDKTDEYPYSATNRVGGSYYSPAESHVDLTRIQNIITGIVQPSPPDVCSDFAERLHNDAEMQGIRCAYVSIDLSTGGHAIDAFQTTDRGLIYIDDTGPSQVPHSLRAVKTVNPQVGSNYAPVSLFPMVSPPEKR